MGQRGAQRFPISAQSGVKLVHVTDYTHEVEGDFGGNRPSTYNTVNLYVLEGNGVGLWRKRK